MLEAGSHYVEIPLSDVVIYLRPNCMLVLADEAKCVEEIDFENLKTICCASGAEEIRYTYYKDNGYEKDYENPEHMKEIRVKTKK